MAWVHVPSTICIVEGRGVGFRGEHSRRELFEAQVSLVFVLRQKPRLDASVVILVRINADEETYTRQVNQPTYERLSWRGVHTKLSTKLVLPRKVVSCLCVGRSGDGENVRVRLSNTV